MDKTTKAQEPMPHPVLYVVEL
uniref:Uncharacterized protein n=1 Tax=Anopheles funestus TaxID=62324 RepID=A0A182RHX6_ANOFN